MEPDRSWEAQKQAQAPEQRWDQAPWGLWGHLFPGWGRADRGQGEGSTEKPGCKEESEDSVLKCLGAQGPRPT